MQSHSRNDEKSDDASGRRPCKVTFVPIKLARYSEDYINPATGQKEKRKVVVKAAAYCRCGWDTPQADRHTIEEMIQKHESAS